MNPLSFDRRIGIQDHPKLVAEYGKILGQMPPDSGLPTQDQVAALLLQDEPLSEEHLVAIHSADFSSQVYLALFDHKVKMLTFLLKGKRKEHEIPSKIQFPETEGVLQHLDTTQGKAVHIDRAKTLTQALQQSPLQVMSLYEGREDDNAILYDPESQIMGEMERKTGKVVGSDILQGYVPNGSKVFSTMPDVFIPVTDTQGVLKLVQGNNFPFWSQDRNFNLRIENVTENGTTPEGVNWYIVQSSSSEEQYCFSDNGYRVFGKEMRVIESTLLAYTDGTGSCHRQHIFDLETRRGVEIPVGDIEEINFETGTIRLREPFSQEDWYGEKKFRISSESRRKARFFGPREHFFDLKKLKEELQKIAEKAKKSA